MKNSPLIFLLLFVLINTGSLIAQQASISGNVVTISGEPIPFVTIVLYDSEKVSVQGTITEENGQFMITSLPTKKSYYLTASFVGYESFTSAMFTLSGNKMLPEIILEENAQSLDEVTLISKKPTISRKADRLVFNVENTIAAQGTTWDILKRTPGVVLKQDALTVRNKNVTVYLNDRKMELNHEEIQSLLESIGGENIKSIEVITNPSAKYDAESGAILNIISSKTLYLGYKGSVTTRGTYGIFPKHYFGTSHFFKTKKFTAFFNYGFNPLKKTKQNNSFIEYQDQTESIAKWYQDFERKRWTKAHNANLILDYELDKTQKLSFSLVGFYSPNEFDFARSVTDITSFIETPFSIGTTSRLDAEQKNLAVDLSYVKDFEKGSMTVNSHYTTFSRDRTQQLSSRYTDNQNELFRTVDFTSEAFQDIEIYTGQIDYETQLGEVNIETGGKIAVIDSRSTIDFLSINNEAVNGLTQAQNDDFLYEENVYAGYLTIAKNINKWDFKTGLRAEQTNSVGTSLLLNEVVDLGYFEWFPSAYVNYEVSENHSFSLDYGRKLYRPRYQDLNPFAYFLNENNFSQGNSSLLPAFSNEINFNYSLKSAYFFDVYYRDNGENILTLPFQDNTNQVLRTDRQNALGSKSWGLDFTHGRSIKKWWYFYTYMSVFHEEETFLAVESDNVSYTNNVNGFYGSFSNFLTISSDKTFTGEVSLAYVSRFLLGSYVQEATTDLTIGVKKTFWNKRATLSVVANDVLGKANALLTSRYLNQNNGFLSVPETQNIQIGFTYNFGNFTLDDNNRELDKKERERLQTGD